MGQFVVGDVVAVPFPLSDLAGNTLRPAVVLAAIEHNDVILCQVTSRPFASKRAINILDSDFSEGKLPVASYVRPDKLFTAEASIIQRRKGQLKSQSLHKVLTSVRELFVIE